MRRLNKEDFHGFYCDMSPKLLYFLILLSDELGVDLKFSNIPAGVGRRLGGGNTSQHNLDKWGEVRAIDGYIPEGVSYQEFYETAKKVGFTGIGLYTGWSGGRGFHVDVRGDRTEGRPATWGAIYNRKTGKTEYTNIWELITGESNGIIRA